MLDSYIESLYAPRALPCIPNNVRACPNETADSVLGDLVQDIT